MLPFQIIPSNKGLMFEVESQKSKAGGSTFDF
jgi:hypothetical protein